MNVYFGKIAPKNKEQIDGHYYRAPKNWPGYNGLSEGDYVYMLCEGVTHLWKALPYDDEQGIRPFEVVLPSVGNCTALLAHIKYLKLSMELAVKSHRQTKGVAFFKLDVDSSFSEEMLINPATYSDPSTFRKVVIRKDTASCVDDSYDLQFYFSAEDLKIKRPLNSDDSYFADYRNNLKFIGGNRPKKDKVLNLVKDPANIDKEFDYESELDLLRVYDAFMVDYNAKEDDVVEVTPETRFWCFNHTYAECSDEERKEFIEWAKSNCSCKMQQEYEVEGQRGSRQVTPNWENIGAIKKDDIVFFRSGDNVFAYGRAASPQKTSDNIVHKSYKDVIKNRSSGNENSTTSFDGLVLFDDADCFYEDFSGHTWAQRVDIEEWFGFRKKSFNVQSKDYYKDGNIYLTIRELKASAASNIIEFFGGQMIMIDKENEKMQMLLENKKNIILQGAPGTGKTYNTAALALSMIDGLPVRDTDEDDKSFHKKVMDEYEKHLIKFDEEGNVAGDGQIGFVTFHQSMDYEDFVEGFKPQKEDKGVIYDIEDGIFKKIRELAFNNYEDSLKSEDEVKLDIDTKTVFERFCSQIEAELKEKDCIDLIPSSKLKIHKVFRRADGSAKSISISRTDTSPNQTLTLEMILRDYPKFKNGEIKSYEDIKPKYDSNSTYHGNAPYYFELLKQMKAFEEEHKISSDAQKVELKNYVLIIDEINRGNVSKIFGELISLLEADKRVGGDHPLTVTLPYSKEPFSVPSNLYIIGTMNTTDRSVGSIDYAVRRRFAFVTLEADENKVPEGNARNLFNAVKNFLNKSKYDMDIEDLMVGHSYFMTSDKDSLKMKWQYEILPLLMEYHKDGIISKSPLKDDSGNEIADVKKEYAKFVEAWQKKESDSPNS